MESSRLNMRVLNRDAIKYIAMSAMLLNHISIMFLPTGSLLALVFEYIGYFTAPTMCFFLVEGYRYTRSKKRYGRRLLIFAVISQIPFGLAFQFDSFNMIYTLLCCFLILAVRETVRDYSLRTVLGICLTLVTLIGDWALTAPVLTILFYESGGNRRSLIRGYMVGYALFVFSMVQNYMMESGCTVQEAVFLGFSSGMGIVVSAVVIVFFYNGKRAHRGAAFSKWFFYVFYPGHLLILYLIYRYVIG